MLFRSSSFYVSLIFVIPFFFLLLPRWRRTKIATTSATLAPLDCKKNTSTTTTHDKSSSAWGISGLKSDSRDDDVILSPNKVRTTNGRFIMNSSNNNTSTTIPTPATTAIDTDDTIIDEWKCNCFSGQQFLPKSIFGNMEAVLKMGTGECYHK